MTATRIIQSLADRATSAEAEVRILRSQLALAEDALVMAKKWLDVLIEDREIDPDETSFSIGIASAADTREVRNVSLATSLERLAAAIAAIKGETP